MTKRARFLSLLAAVLLAASSGANGFLFAPAATAAPAAPLVAGVAPSTADGSLTGTVKIVSSFPHTGSAGPKADSIVDAIGMAIADAGGQVGGATISYQAMDDASAATGAWDGSIEAANANAAVQDPDVVAYIGTYNSGAAEVAIPILCQANMAMISPGNTYPGLTKQVSRITAPGEPNVYYPNCQRNYSRLVTTDDVQGAAGAGWAQQMGAHRVYVVDDGDATGKGVANVFLDTAKAIGLPIVGGSDSIDPQAANYRALATKIQAAQPDLVYFGGVEENHAGQLWQDLRAVLGPDVKLMGMDGINDAGFIQLAGAAAEGTYATSPGVPGSKLTGAGADWYQRYKQQFGEEPDPYAAYAYEATNVVLSSIAQAGTKDRAAIRDAVMGTRNYSGILGDWSFTNTGDTTLTTMTGTQVRNGTWDSSTTVLLQAPQ